MFCPTGYQSPFSTYRSLMTPLNHMERKLNKNIDPRFVKTVRIIQLSHVDRTNNKSVSNSVIFVRPWSDYRYMINE